MENTEEEKTERKGKIMKKLAMKNVTPVSTWNTESESTWRNTGWFLQWQHAILCPRSLKIPLYRATLFAGISPFLGFSLLHSLADTLFCLPCSSLFSSLLSLSTSFTVTFLANFTLFLFFFLSLFFSSEYMQERRICLLESEGIWNCGEDLCLENAR